MQNSKSVATYAQWSSAIGNFILKFGHLEYLVFAYIKDYLSPSPDKVPINSSFAERLKTIENHFVEDRPNHSQELVKWRVELEPIRELRNHIAHGYLHCTFVGNTPDFAVCQVNDLDIECGKRLTFAELQTKNAMLSNLIDQFAALAGWKP